MAAIGGTEAGGNTVVEGGRLRNAHRGDQDNTLAMILGVEAYRIQDLHHLVEVTTTSRTRITNQTSILSYKIMNSIINLKECTTMAHMNMIKVRMSMMSFLLKPRTMGDQCSITTVLLTATTGLFKIPNTMVDILSKTEEDHTTEGPLRAIIETIDLLDSQKRQHLDSTRTSPTSSGLRTLSTRNPVSRPKRDRELSRVF